jgi:hypothetical protein
MTRATCGDRAAPCATGRCGRSLRERLGIEAVGAAIAVAAILAAAALAPARLFLDFRSVQLAGAADGRVALILDRRVRLGEALSVEWSASVDSLADGAPRTVCAAAGAGASVRDDAYEMLFLPIDDWVGDESCTLHPGSPYAARFTYRFSVLGFEKALSRRSAVFMPAGRPDAVCLSECP